MNGWKEDKRWSDKFIPEIKSILGMYLIGEPPAEEDQERNTDLIVLKMNAVRIGCRVRRFKYLKYSDQFTIRAGRPSGIKTELTKVIEGWGDYFFYAFSDIEERTLADWTLCDLKPFRIWLNRELIKSKGQMPGIKKANSDNSSFFYSFHKHTIPGLIVAESSVTPIRVMA